MYQFKSIVLIYILVAFLVLGVFYPGLTGSFLLDDFSNLVTNSAVQLSFFDDDFLYKAWFSGISDAKVSRPLSMLVFAIEYAIFDGFSPYFMKLINVFIHIVNGFLVANLTRLVLARSTFFLKHRYFTFAPLLVFVIWALSPINIGNVLYVVQRMNLLSSLMVLLSLNVYFFGRWQLKARVYLFICFVIAVCLSFIGYGFKDNALLAIFFIGAYEGADRDGFIRKFALGPNRYFKLISIIIALICAWYSWNLFQYYLTGYDIREFSWQERTFIQPQVLATYLAYSFVPIPDLTRFYHDYLALFSGQPIQIFWLLLYLAILAWILFRVFVRSDIICLFTIGWFFIFHLMESTFLALEPAYNHRNYLPLVGLVLGIVYCLFKWSECLSGKLRYLWFLIGAYTICFLLSSILQSMIWGNERVFVEFEADKVPKSSQALFTAGFFSLKNGSTEEESCYRSQQRFRESINSSDFFIGGLYGLWVQRIDCDRKYSERNWLEIRRRINDAALSSSSFLYLAEMLSYCDFKANGDCVRLKKLTFDLSNKNDMALSEKQKIYMLQYIAAKKDTDTDLMEQILRSGLEELPHSLPLNLGILQLLFDLNRCAEYQKEIARIMLLPSELLDRLVAKSKVLNQSCRTLP